MTYIEGFLIPFIELNYIDCYEAHLAGDQQCSERKHEQDILGHVDREKVTFQRAGEKFDNNLESRIPLVNPNLPHISTANDPYNTKENSHHSFYKSASKIIRKKSNAQQFVPKIGGGSF